MFFSACSLFKKTEKINNTNITEKTSCDILCLSTTDSCSTISYDLCSKLCPNWDDGQKKCVQNSSSCDAFYDDCQIEKDFVFEPVLDDDCSFSCNNYIEKCNIQAERSKDVNDQNIFDDCLSQCSEWTPEQSKCIKEAEFCTDIMMECGS